MNGANPRLPRWARWWVVPAAAVVTLAGLGSPVVQDVAVDVSGPGTTRTARSTFWVSSPTDASRRLLRVAPANAAPTTWVSVDTASRRQVWWGTGAALTDASAGLLANRPAAIGQLFDPEEPGGARLNLVRLPLSATDFSPDLWTWAWNGQTATPPAAARASLRLLRSVVRSDRPDLRVIGSPWTAPADMKDTGTLRGGGLSDDRVGDYGRMLGSQAAWLIHHRIPLWALTLGNEPGYGTDYPSMTMTDDQLAELGRAVGPATDDLGVKLLAVDHNWSDRPRVDRVLDAAPGAFDGAAFHCYGGQPGQMSGLAVPRLVTECTGTTDGWAGTFAWDAANLVSRAVAAGSSGLVMWNLALDAAHGPVDTGSEHGCKTCRGLLTVTPSGVRREPEYFTLAQLSRAAAPGAHVIDVVGREDLSLAAFVDRRGVVGVFGHNGTGTAQTIQFQVAGRDDVAYTVAPGELFTLRTAG